MRNEGLGSWIHRRRVKSAGVTAVTGAGIELTYDQLAERIERLASALAARGVSPGSRVAYLGNNHPAFLESLFAAGSLGAVFVPLNTRLAPPEVRFALQDSGSTVLIHAAELDSLAVLGCTDSPVTHRLMVAPEEGPAASPAGTETVSGAPAAEPYEAVLQDADAEPRDVEVGLEDPAIILYTSGTTGNPKGALLTHGNMTWNSVNVLVDYDVSSETVALMIAPLFHVASLGMGALPVLLKGGKLVLHSRFEPGATLAAIEEHRITSLSGVPTTYQMLAEHPGWESTDLSSLRMLTCGGSPVPARVLDAYEERGLSFSGGYGMTETSPGATALPARYSRAKAGSAGLPHFFTDVRIAGSGEAPAGPGEVGEIQIRGGNVIREYWNRPDATSAAFSDGAWFNSGDMGYFDDDGFLYISDRIKDMIISGGENVYPAQVEQLIMELREVSAVAVIGVPDERWGEVPHAVIVRAEGAELDEKAVLDHLEGKLARYKVPKSVEFRESLPTTASGKIRKADLRQNALRA
ncbi:acyl-CoA synthetase [Arthrobacter caoxuetaonis]|uniref:Long-chain fatty acid--CoA ligase n=1 Tax=Arthrobacter caoxuetaonis TaxID=2886935 RepID=A0A9X1MFF1_9MICC|nr:long-chain fatty acid--CoA ligase [Arthrobacter caoxuetaonis]MCC3298230.1 long-chain fatty acid--CoA ligase [Arthrobacter caoxuetaonis]USQ57231.1 long-chain fatty acid--CoA ligase [Arthrobacter caoxuetaonis]